MMHEGAECQPEEVERKKRNNNDEHERKKETYTQKQLEGLRQRSNIDAQKIKSKTK